MTATQIHPTRLALATPVTKAFVTVVDAECRETRRALHRLELGAPALRALDALGLADRVTPQAGGLTWRPDGDGGQIDVTVDVRVRPAHDNGSSLQISTRFTPADDSARDRLLDAWPLVGPLVEQLIKRAAQTVKEYAEHDGLT